MKIILANKYYYPRGGDCNYTINLKELLENEGHKVAIFTQQTNEALESEYSEFWPTEVRYDLLSFSNVKETLGRPIYSKNVKQKFLELVDTFNPEIIHLNNIHSQLSPIIAEVAYEQSIPVIWTLHDYKLICPAYTCLRDGEVCELCFNNKLNVIKHRCVKNLMGSVIAYLESLKWNKSKLQEYTYSFICPSDFLKRKMIEAGYAPQNLVTLNNFINSSKFKNVNVQTKKENYMVYFGRLSKEKGIETLLDVINKLNFDIKIIGTGPLENRLKTKYVEANIQFLGYKSWNELKGIVSSAAFSIVPSEWYENYPYSVIESLCLGTPVLGANIGGIPEIIDETNGLLFESGNKEELKNKIGQMYTKSSGVFNYSQIAEIAKNKFSSDIYYKHLIKLYNSALVTSN